MSRLCFGDPARLHWVSANARSMTCSGKRLRRMAKAGVETASIIRGHRSPKALDGGLHRAARDIPVTLAGASPGDRLPPGSRQSKKLCVCVRVCVCVYGEPRFVSMYRKRMAIVMPTPHTLLRAGGGKEKKEVQTLSVDEPLSRGDVCALSCSISHAQLTLRTLQG